jgi:hypothetical protein
LRENLDFLVERKLVEKQKANYDVTKRGYSVLSVLGPLVKEAKRIELQNFEAISIKLDKAAQSYKKKRGWNLSDFIKIEIVKEE